MSASLRDLEAIKATLQQVVNAVNKQNAVINKFAFMIADMHTRVFPERYNPDGSLKPDPQETHATDHPADSKTHLIL